MERVGYYNGQIGNVDEMTIPLCDRSVFFGDAVYEAVLVLDKKPFALDLHLDRLYNSLKLTKIPFTMERDTLKKEIDKIISLSEGVQTMLYIQVSRGNAPRKHEFPQNAKPNLMMSITPLTLPSKDKKASLITIEDRRFTYCNIKTVNLLPNVFAAQKAHEENATEVLQHRGDQLTEAAHSSILILKDSTLIMPPLDEYILPGITRLILENLCKDNGIATQTRIITVDEVFEADEIILCSTTKNILYVNTIDSKAVGGKDPVLAEKLQTLFLNEIDKQTGVQL
jgi:D-alanine transaminase